MRGNLGEKVFDIFLYIFMIFIVIVVLFPFLNVLATSFNASINTLERGVTIFPRSPTLENYKYIFEFPRVVTGIKISILRTIIGAAATVFCTSMLAYVISRKDFIFRKFTTLIFFLTLYVSGGLVPYFIVIRGFGLHNSFWVYIIPNLIGAYYLILMKAFFQQLPDSLQESAFIDGANDLTVFFRVILPMSMPVVAVVALFAAVFQWNSWFDTRLLAFGNENITTLQYEFQRILLTGLDLTKWVPMASFVGPLPTVSPRSVRMAMIILSIIPMLMIYPFFQKYFIAGMTLGNIKDYSKDTMSFRKTKEYQNII
jgi:putative aldouronate transport system permease protein